MRRLHWSHIDLLRYAGLFTWACVGVPLLVRTNLYTDPGSQSALIGGWVSYLGFGFSYWFLTSELGKRGRPMGLNLVLLSAMTLSAVAIGSFTGTGLGAILLVVGAGVLPWLLPLGNGAIWLVAQNLAIVPVFAARPDFTFLEALLQCGLFLGYSSFTFVTSLVANRQAEARDELRKVNRELRATQALLAEGERVAERLRISRELHDLVGHHLTALSLNLEVASHLVVGKALDHVRQAQTLSKLLLADVREVVSTMRDSDGVQLGPALRELADGVPAPSIHLDLPERFEVTDPRRGQLILRLAQEVITNTIKHAQARNLWLRFTQQDGEVRVDARDDGRGTDQLHPGNGLAGMDERLHQFGGGLEIETAAGKGFRLQAWIPKPALA